MTSTTPGTTAARSPRKPKDHLPTKSEQMQADEKPPVGHDLLRPVTDLRSHEQADAQADIAEIFQSVGIDITDADRDTAVEIETTPDVIRQLGKMGRYIETFVAVGNEEAFVALDKGPGAQGRVMELAMWYLAELGKSDSSAS